MPGQQMGYPMPQGQNFQNQQNYTAPQPQQPQQPFQGYTSQQSQMPQQPVGSANILLRTHCNYYFPLLINILFMNMKDGWYSYSSCRFVSLKF